MTSNSLSSLVWFVVIIALIPVALWLLKRTPMGGSASQGFLRHIAALSIAPNQRIVTIEVGRGEQRRWLVLGVTAGSITTLHTMEPQADLPSEPGANMVPPFMQFLDKLRRDKKGPGEN